MVPNSTVKVNAIRPTAGFLGWLIPLIFGGMAVLLVVMGTNPWAFYTINGWVSVTGSQVWSHLTILGDAMLAAVFLLFWIRKHPEVFWTAVVAALLTAVLIRFLKLEFNMPRPAALLDQTTFYIIGPVLKRNAMPSGHTATVFAILGAWSFSLSMGWKRYGVLCFSLLVGLSRVCVGAHWPADVLAGGAVGSLAAFAAWRLVRVIHRGERPLGRLIGGALLILTGFYAMVAYQTGYPGTLWVQRGLLALALVHGVAGWVALFRVEVGFRING